MLKRFPLQNEAEGGENGGAGGGGGGGAPDGDKPELVQLSQPRLDELLDKAYARGAKNSKDGKEAQALRDEVEQLRIANAEFEKLQAGKGAATGITQEQLDALKSQLKEEYETKIELLSKETAEAKAETADTVGQFRSNPTVSVRSGLS